MAKAEFICCGEVAGLELIEMGNDEHNYAYVCRVCDTKWARDPYDATGEKVELLKQPDQCGNCALSKDTKVENYDVRLFECRRFPPKQGDRQDRPGPHPFPIVKETEWCGEHKPKT